MYLVHGKGNNFFLRRFILTLNNSEKINLKMSLADKGFPIFVGNLPPDVRTKDMKEMLKGFGEIINIDLMNRRGQGDRPPFAFVEFEDYRDAEDAVAEMDGYTLYGSKIRVEFPRTTSNERNGLVSRRRTRECVRRSKYRVIVTGLPPTGSWQDLKDHMREAGEVYFAEVFKDGSGIVEFRYYDDMKYALRKLDCSKFRSHQGERSEIRVEPDYSDCSPGRRRYRSRDRSLSRSRSRSRSR